MNKYIKAAFCMSFGAVKTTWTKLFHPQSFKGSLACYASPGSEITIDRGGKLSIGRMLKIRDGAKIYVRRGGECIIGNDCFINNSSMIVCHERIQ